MWECLHSPAKSRLARKPQRPHPDPKPECRSTSPESRTPDPELMNWRIVLVRPRNPLNIGAAARAMANFGFRDLVLVDPYDAACREARSAVGAEDLVRCAKATCSMSEALDGITLVVGTTSGQRRKLDRNFISLDSVWEWLGEVNSHPRAALLFGSEKTGLSNEHFSYCHALLQIPTASVCPSMNLGQAVAVCCYELARAERTQNQAGIQPSGFNDQQAAFGQRRPHLAQSAHPEIERANAQSLEHVFERAVRVLDGVGYLKPKSRRASIIKLRRFLFERGLSNSDVRILGGILAQIEWKLHG